jgi:hypothetical protein
VAFADLQAQVAKPGEQFGHLRALDAWVVGWLRGGWLGRPTVDIDRRSRATLRRAGTAG